jgi:hypothetical protein
MAVSIKVAPPNSLLFISDQNGGVAPEPVRGAQILSTSSCISVACLMSQDGETEVTLGSAPDIRPGGFAVFDGLLETPNRSVVVSTVEGHPLLEARVPRVTTRIKVWVNRPKEPDQVVIGLA